MTSVQRRDPKQLAQELNKFITDGGGTAIRDLDKMDPQQLIKVRDGLKSFLDRFDQGARGGDPNIAALANSEGVKSLRTLAQYASKKVDDAAVANGNRTASAVDRALAGGDQQLSADDVALGNLQIADARSQVASQKAQVSAQMSKLTGEVAALESRRGRTPADDAVLAGKKAQLGILKGVDQNLDLKRDGLDAAAFALKDGVLTASEARDLQTIAKDVAGKDRIYGQMGSIAERSVARAQSLSSSSSSSPQAQSAAFARNGSNFDPMAMNELNPAALLASAVQGAGSLGVANPAAAFGNVAALGGVAHFAQLAQSGGLGVGAGNGTGGGMNDVLNRFGALASRASGDAFGTDPNLASLRGTGSGGGMFEDRVFEIMSKVVQDFQKKIEERLEKLQKEAEEAQKGGGGGGGKGGMLGGLMKTIGGVAGMALGGPIGGMIGSAVGGAVGGAMGGGGGGGGEAGGGAESRNIEFEKIKYDMQKLSQMQQAMSNVLNSMDELAKSAIHHIKAG